MGKISAYLKILGLTGMLRSLGGCLEVGITMAPDDRINRQNLADSLDAAIDSVLDRIYNYHGDPRAPREVISDVWGVPNMLLEGIQEASGYFLHYFQSQGLGPTNNECVTTSTVMAMNIIEDRLAASQRQGQLQYQASLRIEDYIHDLDTRGVAGWWYRFSTKSPFPGMMTPWGARHALRHHASLLTRIYGKSYRVELHTRRTMDDLIQALEQNKIILLHGAWQKRLRDATDRHLALLGGMPHTMLLVGYETGNDTWQLLNPAEPWLKTRSDPFQPRLFRMTSGQLVDFWGRKFLFYPPRFSITTLTLEN